nr:uncharacterized protein LOC122271099 [Parasteatoda tepidariorum]
MSSGSSNSSENTPLLNGSHEGPCYAYSYTQSREDDDEENGEKMDPSLSPDSTWMREKLPQILSLIQKIFFILLFILCTVSLSFVDVENGEWNSTFISRGRTNSILFFYCTSLKSDTIFKTSLKI